MTRKDAIRIIETVFKSKETYRYNDCVTHQALNMAIEALKTEPTTGSWISEIDTGTWMLKCSVCGCRVQEEKYRVAVGEAATKCPYCGAELGQGGYLYDEYADRPSQRGDGDEA